MKRSAWWSCACVTSLLWACTGTETGNPGFSGTLEYHAYSSAPSSVALQSASAATDTKNAALLVRSTWLVLGEVDFVGNDGCDPTQDASVHAHGLGAGDHAKSAAVTTPVVFDRGSYCGVRLPFLRAGTQVGSAPSTLVGHSMLIEGTLKDGRDFRVRSSMQTNLFLEASPGAFELQKSEPVVLIGFDVATWLAPLDFSHATADADGIVAIESGANDALLSQFEARVASGVALYRDAAASGQVAPDATPIARTASSGQ